MKSKSKFLVHAFFILTVTCVPLVHKAQTVYAPGSFVAGKIRVTKEIFGFNSRSGASHQFGFRMFSVDSLTQSKMLMGNHYKQLRRIVKQDDEASIYLINATHWERSQRICIGITVIGLATVLFIPMDQKTFNIGMGINCVAAGAVLVSYIFKRHWANKSIITWNRHLDERKYIYKP